ncbi:MAG: hypothetical protein JXQ82_01730 [Methanomicrobiaceae archaeon]|nr:hypothetical protein [Methanomicrobiaceae archaeon]
MNKDDSGILSIDFLIGFTIFLIALIIVINMIPGLLLNLQSEAIDYDAVSYRTSVILAEDPGWPSDPETPWEQIDYTHRDQIERLGLCVSSETPNILSKPKIDKFFSRITGFSFTNEDYKDKVIFGDFQYSFNISLKEDSSETLYAGEPVPQSRYGYMKRLVKIKHSGSADLPCGDFNNTIEITEIGPGPFSYDNGISFALDSDELDDKSMSPAYRIDPKNEPLVFRINNFSQSLNVSEIDSVVLTKARFINFGEEVNMPYSVFDNATYIYSVDGEYHTMDDDIDMLDKSQIEFTLFPGNMFTSGAAPLPNLAFNFTYEFNFNGTNTAISADIPYSYDSPYVNKPYLTDGVMEVCIW